MDAGAVSEPLVIIGGVDGDGDNDADDDNGPPIACLDDPTREVDAESESEPCC